MQISQKIKTPPERAPAEKVQEIRDRVAEIETQSGALNQNLEALK